MNTIGGLNSANAVLAHLKAAAFFVPPTPSAPTPIAACGPQPSVPAITDFGAPPSLE